MKQEGDISFNGIVNKFPGRRGWFYVEVPDKLKRFLKEQRREWGMFSIKVYLNKNSWKTKLMTKKGNSFFIAIKKLIRASEGIKLGEKISISFDLE